MRIQSKFLLLLGLICLGWGLLSAAGRADAQAPSETPAPLVTETPTLTPTPSAAWVEACQEGWTRAKCIYFLITTYPLWMVIVIALGAFILYLLVKLITKLVEEWGRRIAEKRKKEEPTPQPPPDNPKPQPGIDPIQDYLNWFITQYETPKFGPRSLKKQYTDRRPATLKEIYLPVQVIFGMTEEERAAAPKDYKGDDPRVSIEDAYDLPQALRRSKILVIIGIAGSGKSTLLQWAGVVCAHALQGLRLKGSEEFISALGEPLFPIFIPLGSFNRYCRREKREPSAQALLDFITWRYRMLCEPRENCGPAPALPDGFFEARLKEGCLLLLDGMDEVPRKNRDAVRRAVQEFLRDHDHARLRVMITARPAAQADAQPVGARVGQVLPLETKQRDQLIRNLYDYYETRPAIAKERGDSLIQRLDAASERVQKLAETPLLTTIFVLIHQPGHELPNQRAEVYDEVINVLLNDLHRPEEISALPAVDAAESDPLVDRARLAEAAFCLHDAGGGEEGMAEDDLINKIIHRSHPHAQNNESLKEEYRALLHTAAQHGGLLDEPDDHIFAFRTHRSFQEFLAGWHLVKSRPPEDPDWSKHYIQSKLEDDNWEEPVRLAAGTLAITSIDEANAFVRMVSGLGNTPAQRDRALALAAVCLEDLPAQRVRADLRDVLAPRILDLIQSPTTSLSPGWRAKAGLALGALRDPRHETRLFDTRLRPGGMPEMVPIPAGEFWMGSGDEDEEKLSKQNVNVWPDEKPTHRVEISSDYEIARYPVTNAEFKAFIQAGGYGAVDGEKPEWWSVDGWRWRTGGWQSDLRIYPSPTQERVREWLARRPVELRGQPFFWNDPRWNGANQPVVGVTWFEAEAYAHWLSVITGASFRLPCEAEWEKATRAGQTEQVRCYWPWGDVWDANKCNNTEPDDKLGGTSPVGIYPLGNTFLGCADMVGNVWEWCQDWYNNEEYSNRTQSGQPVVDPNGPATGSARVVRGGSWLNSRSLARCAYRYGSEPVNDDNYLGFRLVCAPPKSS